MFAPPDYWKRLTAEDVQRAGKQSADKRRADFDRLGEPENTEERVYRNMQVRAEYLSTMAYLSQMIDHVKKGRKPSTFRYNPPEIVRTLCAESARVLGGEITPEQGMGLLWTYDAAEPVGIRY